LPHRLRHNPFAVCQYGFMNYFLAVAATLAREYPMNLGYS
jgi:hypothetical protein